MILRRQEHLFLKNSTNRTHVIHHARSCNSGAKCIVRVEGKTAQTVIGHINGSHRHRKSYTLIPNVKSTDIFTHSINLKKNQVLPKAKIKRAEEKETWRKNSVCYSREEITTQITCSTRVCSCPCTHKHKEENKKHLYAFYELKGSLKWVM